MTDDTELVREAHAMAARLVGSADNIAHSNRQIYPCAELLDGATMIQRLTARLDAERGKQWRHLKRGTIYTEVGRGELQTARDLVDGSTLVSYRGEDGRLWFREEGEFEDGRFDPLPTPPEADHG